jgi:hypothetical protein
VDAPLGLIEVYQDGRVEHDGKDITNAASVACGVSHKVEAVKVEAAIVEPVADLDIVTQTPQSENGQKPVDPIEFEPIVEVEQLSVKPAEEDLILQGGAYRE